MGLRPIKTTDLIVLVRLTVILKENPKGKGNVKSRKAILKAYLYLRDTKSYFTVKLGLRPLKIKVKTKILDVYKGAATSVICQIFRTKNFH